MPGPQLWVFAGPNGAGKSTLAERFLRDRLPIVNPDAIAVELAQQREGFTSEIEAGRLALRLRRDFVALKFSFAFETTLTGFTELRTRQSAREASYKINLVFVCLESWQESVSRIGTRVEKGGHDVAPEAVRRRYSRSLANFERANSLADRTILLITAKPAINSCLFGKARR